MISQEKLTNQIDLFFHIIILIFFMIMIFMIFMIYYWCKNLNGTMEAENDTINVMKASVYLFPKLLK